MGGKIVVLGSSNMDLIIRIPRFHEAGETILGQDVAEAYGGKGANQAVAAKRLGGDVTFVTKLGNDSHGKGYRQYLKGSGLPVRGLLMGRTLATGTAWIEVTPAGENRIIVSPGANRFLSPEDVRRRSGLWRGVKVFVCQLEIPLPTVAEGLKMAKRHGALTLLNPSPPVPLPSGIFSRVDYLVPNEVELRILTGDRGRERSALRRMAGNLLDRGVSHVVVTLGPRGAFLLSPGEEIWTEAFKANARDTTAAGDAFMGALACGLSEGRPIREVLQRATGAGALATTRSGAQPSLPTRRELDRFLRVQDWSVC